MLHVEVESPSPPSSASASFPAPGSVAALAALSRNASVISSSSSSSSSSSLLLNTVRPGPIRTFSSPRNRSPTGGSSTPTRAKAPLYLSKELLAENPAGAHGFQDRASANKSRSNSMAGRLGPNDFEFGEVLGEGSYSTVMSAIYPPTRKAYAIKIMDKEHLTRKNMVRIAGVEKNVLVKLRPGGHPGIVKLHWAFQDQWSWYFVLDLIPKGELQTRLSRLGSICLPCARWYTAQIIDTITWMHARGVLHRDLKPENVLLDDNMRIKITDFGSAKILDVGKEGEDESSWVGTPQYVPPELLLDNTMCKSSDFWAIGCILYQMICGSFPFQGASNYVMWVKVKTLDYSFPDGFDNTARDLVAKLLVLYPDARLGVGAPGTPNDLSALRAHPFFESLSWERIWSDPVPPCEVGIVKKEIPFTGSKDVFGVNEDGGVEEQSVEPKPGVNGGAVAHSPDSSVDSDFAEQMRGRIPPPGHPSGTVPLDIHDAICSNDDSSPNENPTGRLGGIFESLALSTRSRRPSTTSHTSAILSDPSCWMPVLRPSETPVFSSCVYKATRRAFPRQLLPLSGSTKKGLNTQGRDRIKLRLLVLTKTRLLCLKDRDGEVVVKSEILIGGQGGGIGVVTGVEKGDQTFVVQTISKSYTYSTEDSMLTARWVKEIGDALPTSTTYRAEQQQNTPERTRSS